MSLAAVPIPVALSTASVFPEPCEYGFQLAAELGYDGVEVMVWTDPVSQDPAALQKLSKKYRVPILAVHAPCLIITQRVWGADPWLKLQKAHDVAEQLGSSTVVLHSPFRWQRDYSKRFVDEVASLQGAQVRIAVENMFPLWVRGRAVSSYRPSWDVAENPSDYDAFTLDLSHASVSQSDPVAMLERMAGRLHHLHVADGTGLAKDEHLVPGRGNQPVAEVLELAAARGFAGTAVIEINTRRAVDRAERRAAVAAALAFCRLHLVRPSLEGPPAHR